MLKLLCLCCFLSAFKSFGQHYTVSGKVVDAVTHANVPEVEVNILGTIFSTITNAEGTFKIEGDIPAGDQSLILKKLGFVTLRLPILLENGNKVHIPLIPLETDFTDERQLIATITLGDEDLNGEEDRSDYGISGLLAASKDAFLRAAAFDFGSTFFRPRGLDSRYGKVLINGIEMNKLYDGRPQWGNWGGLNDAQRNQEFNMGLAANDYTFGSLAGTTNITMRASQYQRGGRLSYAAANRTYTGRIMGTYSSGMNNNGWAYSLSLGRRFGNSGYVEGTPYDANSIFVAVEKKINDEHSLNFSAIYTPNIRGRGTALTQEVIDLKSNAYNPSWGYQNGKRRSSRFREIKEPILMLNHFWTLGENLELNTNLAYQFGSIANTRIDNGGTRLVVSSDGQESYLGGARNPLPNYYQNLPSYFLRDKNPSAAEYQLAYTAEQNFLDDGQLDWNTLYEGNQLSTAQGGNSVYALQEDVVQEKRLSGNILMRYTINPNINAQGGLTFVRSKSQNFARIRDLLGGSGFLDIDSFAENDINFPGNKAQSDLRHRNRIVGEGDRYKYDYDLDASIASVFGQAQFRYDHWDGFVSAKAGKTSYQRTGNFENGYFPGSLSFGESQKPSFFEYGIKTGLTYKFTGRHILDINAGYLAEAPTLRNTFPNSRQNSNLTTDISTENSASFDAGYIYRSPKLKGRLTGYFTQFKRGSNVSFFFTQSLQGIDDSYAFVQEIMTGVKRQNIGLEFGIESQITPTLKLKAAAAIGQNTYNNNPGLYYTSDDIDGEVRFGDGRARLKNLHVSGGPERAYQLGFEYSDPDYWWVGVAANYFEDAYLGVSNLRRSAAFAMDGDGQPLNNYDPAVAKTLLAQEKLGGYMLVNVIGGKSWRIDGKYVGFFLLLNNILDQNYKTGGFEDSRIADYAKLKEEKGRDRPLFGNRYFLGYGATFYANVYFRF